MRFSNSELLTLLQHAFEGAGWTDGREEDAAHAVWWLQAHGITWLDQLPDHWERLNPERAPKLKLVQANAASGILDAAGSSLLHSGANAIDLVYANACRESLAMLETRWCLDRHLILPGLVTLARRGGNALARWYASGRLHLASIEAGKDFPLYTQYEAPAPMNTGKGSLYLACSNLREGLDHYHRNKSRLDEQHPVVDQITPDQFAHNARLSLSEGIEVDPATIALLNQSADSLLVGLRKPPGR